LEFPQRLPACATVKLTTNYRSHRAIVERYDRWMASADWSNPRGASFRYDKTIEADAAGTHPDYPSVIAIWGKDKRDEAARFADLIEFLRKNEVIEDYGQVALLLHSVREDHSGPYLATLEARGIPAFCPRARAYFEIPEVRVELRHVIGGRIALGGDAETGARENDPKNEWLHLDSPAFGARRIRLAPVSP